MIDHTSSSFVESKNWDQLTSALYYAMPPCELDHLVLLEARAKITHHPLPNVKRMTFLLVTDIEEQLSFDLPPLRLAPAQPPQRNTSDPSSPQTGPPGTDTNATPKPPSSKNKKKKKKKQAKPTAKVHGDSDNGASAPKPVPENPTSPAKFTATHSAMQDDSDDSDEPPPLVNASKKKTSKTQSQPKGVADDSDGSDTMPPLIPASQAAGPSAKSPKKPKPSPPAPAATPDTNFFGPGGHRLFEALGKNPNMMDSMMRTFPGFAEALGSGQTVEEWDSSGDDDPTPDKFQCEPSSCTD